MKLSFYGAAETVTGSCYLLECAGTKILIDCGMFQGSQELSDLNKEDFAFPVKEIEYMILTHAHMDHSGRIPKLAKEGFKGTIYTTEASIDLCEIMLQDSAHIQEMDAEYETRKNSRKGLPPAEPLYTAQDALDSMQFFSPVKYNTMTLLTDHVKFRLNDAGHMLGSSIIEIWAAENGREEKIVFSGDLGNKDQPLLNDPAFIEETDFLVMESTYGGRNHTYTKSSNEFLNIIKETAQKGGNLVIPSFAVGRTQELLYEINNYKENDLLGKYNDIKVILDSPLAIRTTEIFKKYYNILDKETQELLREGDDPLVFDNLIYSLTTDESKAINFDQDAKIIISASGMCDAGRIRHHIKHNIYKENCTVLFVGYQAEGTLGRLLLDGVKDIKIFGERVAVKAKIESLDYFSGHADHNGIMKWIQHYKKKPKKIILVHGELEGLNALKEAIDGIGLNALIAKYKTTIDFDKDVYETDAAVTLPTRKESVSKLSDMAKEILEELQKEENLLKVEDVDKIKLFLSCIHDILTSE